MRMRSGGGEECHVLVIWWQYHFFISLPYSWIWVNIRLLHQDLLYISEKCSCNGHVQISYCMCRPFYSSFHLWSAFKVRKNLFNNIWQYNIRCVKFCKEAGKTVTETYHLSWITFGRQRWDKWLQWKWQESWMHFNEYKWQIRSWE
jgi:hypothetical protein